MLANDDALLLGYLPAVAATPAIALDACGTVSRAHLVGDAERATAELIVVAARAGIAVPPRPGSADPIERDLLRAIARGDDASRDVYADWLEARGETRADRPPRADRWMLAARAAGQPGDPARGDRYELGCAAGDLYVHMHVAESVVAARAGAPQLFAEEIAQLAVALDDALTRLAERRLALDRPPDIAVSWGMGVLHAYGRWVDEMTGRLRAIAGWPRSRIEP